VVAIAGSIADLPKAALVLKTLENPKT
jgi:hypothetical protein